MSEPEIRPSFISCCVSADWNCDICSFNKLNLEEVWRHSEKEESKTEGTGRYDPQTHRSGAECSNRQHTFLCWDAKCWHKECFPYNVGMLPRPACSTIWMEIKASCNCTLTWTGWKSHFLGGIGHLLTPFYVNQRFTYWPPRSEVNKPDQ